MLINSEGKKVPKQALGIFLIAFGCFLVYMLSPFIASFLGAIIFYVLFRPLMRFLCQRKKWKRWIASSVILLISFLVVLLPITIISYMMVPKLSLFFGDTSMIMQTIKDFDARIKTMTGIQVLSEQNLNALQAKATGFIAGFFSESLNALISIGMMYLLLFYMLQNFGVMEKTLEEFLPFNRHNVDRFSNELKAQTFSNALGTPLHALLQCFVATLGYWIFGLNEPIFWGVMTGFFSFVPVVGSAAIWLPAAAIMISNGSVIQGVSLAAYGLIVMSISDNAFMMLFQKKFANVHPLVSVLGFIIGVAIFGIPGIIFGPLLISYFLILVKIYKEEYMNQLQ